LHSINAPEDERKKKADELYTPEKNDPEKGAHWGKKSSDNLKTRIYFLSRKERGKSIRMKIKGQKRERTLVKPQKKREFSSLIAGTTKKKK